MNNTARALIGELFFVMDMCQACCIVSVAFSEIRIPT